MVPCSGLYADVSDDSIEQKMMEGVDFKAFQNHPKIINSGFRALSDGLYGIRREQLDHLQQMVSNSNNREEAGHLSFREWYRSYKESYVKRLRFDPEETNLSNVAFHQNELTHLYFSCCDRTRSTGGSVCLL